MEKGATFDTIGIYRYGLTRRWYPKKATALFIMLNPSTADAEIEDPTVRRCMGYARDWGCGGLEVVNIFALRSTDPAALYTAEDPIGPENNRFILEAAERAQAIIAAWGTHGKLHGRGKEVLKLLEHFDVWSLGTTSQGHPKHPLYLRKDLTPEFLQKGRPSL